ncbi:unnamed protein product [Choristocarpus tenellus]
MFIGYRYCSCCSSLVSILEAIATSCSHESDLSLVGCVGLILEPSPSIFFSRVKIFSLDGRFETFDDSANGYVRGVPRKYFDWFQLLFVCFPCQNGRLMM